MNKAFVSFVCLSSIFLSCSKDQVTEILSDEEIALTLQYVENVTTYADIIIENAIDAAIADDGIIDPAAVADSIQQLDEVKSAVATQSGAGTIVENKDGSFMNIILGRRDDDRLFEVISSKKSSPDRYAVQSLSPATFRPYDMKEVPDGKKAIILAPFQTTFKDYLTTLQEGLWSIGYDVTIFQNADANLSRFRYDYLKDFDVIIIATHGLAQGRTRNGLTSTILVTGQRATATALGALNAEEQRAVAISSVQGISYFALSVPWLQQTKTGDFSTSWFFANACESSITKSGSSSLSAYLLANGVGGFSGYNGSIYTELAKSINRELLNYMVQGQSLQEATSSVRNDQVFRFLVWILSFKFGELANIDYLEQSTRVDEPFYLFTNSYHFPYNRCRFKFWSRASYDEDVFLPVFTREVDFTGSFKDGKFTGSYTYEDDNKNINDSIVIEMDLDIHSIKEFKVTGREVENNSSGSSDIHWSIESTAIPFEGNTTNAYFSASGADVENYTGTVTFSNEWVDAIYGTSGETNLTGINYDNDSELEIQFTEVK